MKHGAIGVASFGEAGAGHVCRRLPLTCLAPDIVEAILDGRQPKGLRLSEMLGVSDALLLGKVGDRFGAAALDPPPPAVRADGARTSVSLVR